MSEKIKLEGKIRKYSGLSITLMTLSVIVIVAILFFALNNRFDWVEILPK